MSTLTDLASQRKSNGNPFPPSWFSGSGLTHQAEKDLLYTTSQNLVAAGLSLIPIEAETGTKAPDKTRLPSLYTTSGQRPSVSWSAYQLFRPTPEVLRRWHDISGLYGLAVVTGTVSGGLDGHGLEVIDFDQADLAAQWLPLVEQQAPGLIAALVQVHTPRPGRHFYYRCAEYGASQKLACSTACAASGQPLLDATGQPVRKTLIETKGEGGYCLIPPSPARCHPTLRRYDYVMGSPTLHNVPVITPAQRQILLDAARTFNRWLSPPSKPTLTRSTGSCTGVATGSLRPGDDYNARAHWAEILLPHHWSYLGSDGTEQRWCRPGKSTGVSATVNYQECDKLHVFSSNAAPFDADESYSKFAAYTLLNHKGNYQVAADCLPLQRGSRN